VLAQLDSRHEPETMDPPPLSEWAEDEAPSLGSAPSPPPAYPSTAPASIPPALSPQHVAVLSRGSLGSPPLPKDLPATASRTRTVGDGKYVLEELLGEGGVGEVYRATHRDLRKKVAIKVLHASFQKDLDFCSRFVAEALAASRLDHPNITRVIDFGQQPDG